MKISLSKEKDIHVLTIEGEVQGRDAQVMRAGIRKILVEGKNRILVHFAAASQLSSEVVHELAYLNLIARELKGQIVVSGLEPGTQQKVQEQSSPPPLSCHAKRDDAVKAFAAKPVGEPAAETSGAGGLLDAMKKKDDEIADLRNQLRGKEATELGNVRSDAEKQKGENAMLKERLNSWVSQKRDEASEVPALKGKAADLEDEIRDLYEQLEKATGQKKP